MFEAGRQATPGRRALKGALVAAAGLVLASVLSVGAGPRWLRVPLGWLHPELHWVEPAALVRELPNAWLGDVRTREEFRVSHLPGAHFLGEEGQHAGPPPEAGRRLVVYCAVGARSAAVGDELSRRWGRPVYNLQGGIFAWSEAELPLEDAEGERVSRVHPYDRFWALWLDPEQRASLDDRH